MLPGELAPGRQEALYKLLQLGPEPMNNLVRFTGWPQEQTQIALERLLAERRVSKVKRAGSVAVFQVSSE